MTVIAAAVAGALLLMGVWIGRAERQLEECESRAACQCEALP